MTPPIQAVLAALTRGALPELDEALRALPVGDLPLLDTRLREHSQWSDEWESLRRGGVERLRDRPALMWLAMCHASSVKGRSRDPRTSARSCRWR